MAKYNAAKHTIESDDGSITLATLHPTVRADNAFEIADSWAESPDFKERRSRIGELEDECNGLETRNDRLNDDLTDAQDEIVDLEQKLEEARAKIEELQGRITELETEKGSAA